MPESGICLGRIWLHVAGNGFVLMLPVLLWNVLLTRKLPRPFIEAVFHKDIPAAIRIPERGLRAFVLVLPGFATLGGFAEYRFGYLLYLAGLAAYFQSWLALIRFPQSRWSRSLAGRVAPAVIPGLWLVGIGLVSLPYVEDWTWFRPIFFGSVFGFLVAHFTHVWFVHRRDTACMGVGRASNFREN